MEGHDELVALELPHLVGDGLDLEECITADSHRQRSHTGRERLHQLQAKINQMKSSVAPKRFEETICGTTEPRH